MVRSALLTHSTTEIFSEIKYDSYIGLVFDCVKKISTPRKGFFPTPIRLLRLRSVQVRSRQAYSPLPTPCLRK